MHFDNPPAMPTDPHADAQHLHGVLNHPLELSFVVRLHRESNPAGGQWRGQVQHLASGERAAFWSADDLQAWIAQRADLARASGL